MKVFTTVLLAIGIYFTLNAQKRVMDPSVYAEWNSIRSEAISHNGQWVKYHITPGKGDNTLVLYNTSNDTKLKFQRVKRSMFTEDSEFLIFSIGAAQDSITAMKRRKVDKKDMPKDTLVMYNLALQRSEIIPDVGSFQIPKKWSGILAFQADLLVPSQDTSKKEKSEQRFFVDYLNGSRDTFANVDGFSIAEEENALVFYRNGKDTSVNAGVFYLDTDQKREQSVISEKGTYKNVVINREGQQISYVADLDTTKRRQRPYELYFWANGKNTKLVASNDRLDSPNLYVTENTKPTFSEDGSKLYFGLGEEPVMADSLALENEMVQVEVWTTEDPMLYTMQEQRKDVIERETYQVLFDIEDKSFQMLESDKRKQLQKSNKGNGPYYLVRNAEPYMKSVTWRGRSTSDVYLVDGRTGKEKEIAKALTGSPSFSPGGKYVYWYDQDDLNWFTYDIQKGSKHNLTDGFPVSIFDELNDLPAKPRSYGLGGWIKEDEYLLINDRYDIWKVDPTGEEAAVKLTNGRQEKLQRRIIDLDPEKEEVDTQALVYLFNEDSKESGYGQLDLNSGELKTLQMDDFSFRRRPIKAKNSPKLIYNKESFVHFPDLILSDRSFKKSKVISNVNTQQDEYRWGTIEIFEWTDFKGQEVQGLLVKPEDFDPLKKYPVIVNFYERSSNGLHRHRAPEPHRSTINYSYYANKGYVIFNPDIAYEIGEPGASAYNAVVSGVEALSKNQFVDKTRIGIQGHSWGGYQIAHILNKTDIFKCAESGAPVVNMVSAYGGIRWGSGMSRMFQYEKTQSRLGKTLWEDPEMYLRNSPIFEVDKMNTPVLILHNDNDTAVPWYQGIEYFMALRRLGKPAWFLNYNGEPHWPLKWENRVDFNKRMEQFFAHFLLDQPMPRWMKEGVNVVNKGINQGFEIDK